MKAYITKYALTSGILEKDVRQLKDSRYVTIPDLCFVSLRIGRDVFYDKKEALEDAENRREKKIAQLTRALNATKSKRFTAQ